jgi:hypothetical protein
MVRVREGDKERLQAFEGLCIAKRAGTGQRFSPSTPLNYLKRLRCCCPCCGILTGVRPKRPWNQFEPRPEYGSNRSWYAASMTSES